MKTRNRKQTLRSDLAAIIREEFDDPAAPSLFRSFLHAEAGDPAVLGSLVGVASGRAGRPSWPLRRAATLLLETLLLAVPEDDPGGSEVILRAIAEASRGGLTYPPAPSILREGYTTTDPAGFARELRARLARHGRVHRGLKGSRTSPEALRDFLDLARHEPSLTLARYFFSPDEVADRVLEQVRTSLGMHAPILDEFVDGEAEALVDEWPEYERAVLRRLLEGSDIFWGDDSTGSRINTLVEYPIGTIVLVVKLPGGDLEIEIKRAGRRGGHPLSVVYERDGFPVCSTHRLDAGSLGSNLRAEATAAATLAHLYRLIHDRAAPIPLTVAHRTIHSIPCRGGTADLLDFFTEPATFGRGFEAMRQAMARSTRAFASESGTTPIDAPGDLGATADFLALTNPSQSVIAPTTSYRLDLVASYLGRDGLDHYFRRGLGVEPSAEEARRLAGTLLDVALGTHHPVDAEGLAYGELVEALFAQPENRRQADAIYLDLAAQAGEFWGTLYGLKAYSLGESVVGRNVGLRAFWGRGAWHVRLIFMDHDQLKIPREHFAFDLAFWGVVVDAAHVALAPRSGRKSELDLLAAIYRVDDPDRRRGRAAFLEAARTSSDRTREALRADPRVRALYDGECLGALIDWEDAIAGFVRSRRSGVEVEAAATEGAELLLRRGRTEPEAATFRRVITLHSDFLDGFSALFQASA